jgi:hypothetical protein
MRLGGAEGSGRRPFVPRERLAPSRQRGTAIPRENEQRSKAGRQIDGRENAHESLLRRFCAIRRANKSVGPPAANPTITFTVPPAKSRLRQWASNACYQGKSLNR